jgi:phosphatidylglycerol:prolipoprotein diacylglycerol transferase
MRPIVFEIGGVGVPAFFFMIMVGALAATFYAVHVAKKEGADEVAILDFGIIGIIAAVIGARFFHIIVENPSYYIERPIRVFFFWQGGFVSIGAYIFTIIGWIIYMKKRGLDYWRYFDIAAVAVPVIIFFVRSGCFMAGCCYGKPTDFFIHLRFFNPAALAARYGFLGVALHATQVYFMLNAVIMFFVLHFVYAKRKFHGQVLASFFIYYGLSRFLIEFLRGDADRGMWFGGYVSTGQIAMLFSFLGGIAMWFIFSKKNRELNG